MHTKLIFHILAPRPLSSRLGAFFYPKHSPVKIFRKFFQPKVGELFSIFMARKIMGVKGSCRSANRGGCPLLYALYISNRLSFASASWLRQPSQGQKGIESGQKVAKVNIYLLGFVSPREFRRQQTAKFKIYLNFEGAGASVVALSLGQWWCLLVQVVQGAGASGVLRCVFRPFLPAFALFPAFLSCFAFQICPYLAFLGGF